MPLIVIGRALKTLIPELKKSFCYTVRDTWGKCKLFFCLVLMLWYMLF